MNSIETFYFWFGTIIFFTTYVVIASDKVHKTTAAMAGAMLMLLLILKGPVHEHSEDHILADSGHDTIEHVVTHSDPPVHIPILEKEKEVMTIHSTMHESQKAEVYDRMDVFSRYVDFDVIFTLAGMMLLVNLLSSTGLFQWVAIKCAKIAKGCPVTTMLLLVVATAVLSAFLDNVTTVLLIAPVTLLVCAELGVPVIPFLMAETISSNIGGTATLIGDPPNLIIGSYVGFSFGDFMINLAPFIIVLVICYCLALKFYYNGRMNVTVEKRALIMELDENAAITDSYNMKRGGAVMILTIFGFLIHGFVGLQPSVVAMSGATLALVFCKVDVDHALEKIEWSTLFFFLGLFVLVYGAVQVGLMAKFGDYLALTKDLHPLMIIIIIMWVSGICAAIMNNVSFTIAMVTIVATFLNDATMPFYSIVTDIQAYKDLLWWGLALAVCLGGNGTIVGAAANLVTASIAEKNGHKISFVEFIRYGVPVTIFTLIASSAYVSIRYYITCT